MRILCAAIVILTAGAASGQADIQPFTRNAAALAPEVELPPRYRIEFIVFAHKRFDENEEHFDIVPPSSQFAAKDEPIPIRFFDADSRQSLHELIEGPISAPPPEESDDERLSDESAPLPPVAVDALGDDAVLEAYLDPRLVEGPNTRYLDLDELTLLPTLDRLERLDAYTPLIHTGWEQNGLAEADAVPVDLEEFDSTNPRGTIRLHMSRFLHIAVDLAYRDEPPVTDPEPQFGDFAQRSPLPPSRPGFGFPAFEEFAQPALPEYFMLEQRRILRGELNYFDHPAFGLLLQITLAPEPGNEPEPDVDGPSA